MVFRYREGHQNSYPLWGEKLFSKLRNEYNFDGFHHCTDFENFVKVMQSGKLYCRSKMEQGEFHDAAMTDCISHGGAWIQDYVRMYWREKTPTNYMNEGIKSVEEGFHMPIPVFLIFDYKIASHDNVWFADRNATKSDCEAANDIKYAYEWDWESVFNKDQTIIPNDYLKSRRCAEFLYEGELSTKYLKKIVFRSQADLKRAINVLGLSELYTVDKTKFYNHQRCRGHYVNYIDDYSIERVGNQIRVTIEYCNEQGLNCFKHGFELSVDNKMVAYSTSPIKGKSIIYTINGTSELDFTKEKGIKLLYKMNDIICIEQQV